jgi:hypothetical protein
MSDYDLHPALEPTRAADRTMRAIGPLVFVGGLLLGLGLGLAAGLGAIFIVGLALIAVLGGMVALLARTARNTRMRVTAGEASYRAFFDHAVEGIFRTTPDGAYLAVN